MFWIQGLGGLGCRVERLWGIKGFGSVHRDRADNASPRHDARR